MSEPFQSVYRREANTEAGQDQYNYEKVMCLQLTYGGSYRSRRNNKEFSRVAYIVCTRLSRE